MTNVTSRAGQIERACISVILPVQNGLSLLRCNLCNIYPYASEIIVVLGPLEACSSLSKPNCESLDDTERVRSFSDPDNKLRIITGSWSSEADKLNAAMDHVSGDYVWVVRVGEMYCSDDLHRMLLLLAKHPTIDEVHFTRRLFSKLMDFEVVSSQLTQPPNLYRRIFRCRDGLHFERNMSLIAADESNGLAEARLIIEADQTAGMGLYLYDYTFVSPTVTAERLLQDALYRLYPVWTDVGQYNRDTQDTPTRRRHQTHYEQFEITSPNVTGVQFRFLFRGADSWAGATHLRMEADYQAADTTFKPIEVTYNWTEYYEPLPGNPNSGGITRTHTERVTCLPHKYNVNCGGDIQPRMNWMRVNLEGSSPDAVTLGYSDATDHGDKYAIPQERFDYGQVLSIGKSYTQSTDPASATYGAEAGELTDGLIRFPQVEGSWPATELAHWPNGVGALDITLDLGSAQSVGGARVDAYAYSSSDVRFPSSVEVQSSLDGTTFTSQGTDRYKGARYAHNNWNVDWPLYPRHDSPDWDVFPDYGLRGNYIFVPFDGPVSAQYVKFLVTQITSKGLMLSEVNVFDTLTAEEWTPRLTHEPSLTDPVAYVDVDEVTGCAPMIVNFDASGSSDPDGSIVRYVWDFGDAHRGSGAGVSHTYRSAGTYTVTLTITDDDAHESMVRTYITVAESRR